MEVQVNKVTTSGRYDDLVCQNRAAEISATPLLLKTVMDTHVKAYNGFNISV